MESKGSLIIDYQIVTNYQIYQYNLNGNPK